MKRVLMFGYQSPPIFGPSVAYETLLQSEFARHFEVTFINLSVVKSIQDLERFRLGKLCKLAGFIVREVWYLLTRRPDVLCYPIAYNWQAFLKDRVLVGLARWFNVPVVLWAHGTGARRFRDSMSNPRPFEKMLQSAQAILVLADCLHADFTGLVPTDRVHTITLGIPSQPMPPRRSDGHTVLYLGALIQAKGIFDLLAAVPLIPAARLVVAGEWFKPEDERVARDLITRLKIDAAITFVGPIHGSAKQELFGTADVFVFPPHSQTEAFGLVLLEALRAGLPIVTTHSGARSEIVIDGINGFLSAEGNSQELAAKITSLLADKTLRDQMQATNRDLFERKFTQEHYARAMIDLFDRLMSVPATTRST